MLSSLLFPRIYLRPVFGLRRQWCRILTVRAWPTLDRKPWPALNGEPHAATNLFIALSAIEGGDSPGLYCIPQTCVIDFQARWKAHKVTVAHDLASTLEPPMSSRRDHSDSEAKLLHGNQSRTHANMYADPDEERMELARDCKLAASTTFMMQWTVVAAGKNLYDSIKVRKATYLPDREMHDAIKAAEQVVDGVSYVFAASEAVVTASLHGQRRQQKHGIIDLETDWPEIVKFLLYFRKNKGEELVVSVTQTLVSQGLDLHADDAVAHHGFECQGFDGHVPKATTGGLLRSQPAEDCLAGPSASIEGAVPEPPSREDSTKEHQRLHTCDMDTRHQSKRKGDQLRVRPACTHLPLDRHETNHGIEQTQASVSSVDHLSADMLGACPGKNVELDRAASYERLEVSATFRNAAVAAHSSALYSKAPASSPQVCHRPSAPQSRAYSLTARPTSHANTSKTVERSSSRPAGDGQVHASSCQLEEAHPSFLQRKTLAHFFRWLKQELHHEYDDELSLAHDTLERHCWRLFDIMSMPKAQLREFVPAAGLVEHILRYAPRYNRYRFRHGRTHSTS